MLFLRNVRDREHDPGRENENISVFLIRVHESVGSFAVAELTESNGIPHIALYGCICPHL